MRTLAHTEDDELCPGCGRGRLVHRNGPHGLFDGCSRFPECDWSARRGSARSRISDYRGGPDDAGDWSVMYNVEETHDFPGEGEMIRGF